MRKLLLPAACLAAYLAWPYVTLARIGLAVHAGNAAALASEIDWDQVREGVKEDVADAAAGAPAARATPVAATSGDDLPAFGASFVSSLSSTMIDRELTPAHLTDALASMHGTGGQAQLSWAFFTGPTRFEVALRPAAERAGDPPVRLRLDLGATGWKITRAWVPPQFLERLDTHSS